MTYAINDILDVLPESTYDYFCESFLFLEDAETIQNKKSFADKASNVITNMSKKYASGLTKRSEFVANKIVKKPTITSPKIQEKFEKDINKAKAVYKVGEILVVEGLLALLPGPFNLLATPPILKSLKDSDDPADKMVLNKLKMLTDKANALKEKAINLVKRNKGKQVTEENFVRPMDAIALQGKNIAKEIDAVGTKVNKPATVTESTLINKFDEYLIKEDGNLVDNAYEILNNIVEKTDYTKYDIFPVIEHYIDMMI